MSKAKTKPPPQAPTSMANQVLPAHPRPDRDLTEAAKDVIARYPVIMARLAE